MLEIADQFFEGIANDRTNSVKQFETVAAAAGDDAEGGLVSYVDMTKRVTPVYGSIGLGHETLTTSNKERTEKVHSGDTAWYDGAKSADESSMKLECQLRP